MFVFQHNGPVTRACIVRADDGRLVAAYPAACDVAFLALIRAGLRRSSVKYASGGKAIGDHRVREDGVRLRTWAKARSPTVSHFVVYSFSDKGENDVRDQRSTQAKDPERCRTARRRSRPARRLRRCRRPPARSS